MKFGINSPLNGQSNRSKILGHPPYSLHPDVHVIKYT